MKLQTTNPILAAREVHESLGWAKPGDLTIEEMAMSFGAMVKEASIEGSEGRILINGDSAIISYSSKIILEGKKNFVLGHELAHFLLHPHLAQFFSDTGKTLSEWHTKGKHEQEANQFAAELLMPSHLFEAKVKQKRLNIALIKDISQYFNVSMTAAFLKYRELGAYPIMIIYIEDKIIKWKQHSKDFPFQFLPLHTTVPIYTVAGDYFNGSGIEDIPQKVDAIEWFPDDYEIRSKSNWKLWEQCYQVSDKGIISCLWTY